MTHSCALRSQALSVLAVGYTENHRYRDEEGNYYYITLCNFNFCIWYKSQGCYFWGSFSRSLPSLPPPPPSRPPSLSLLPCSGSKIDLGAICSLFVTASGRLTNVFPNFISCKRIPLSARF